MGVFDNGVRAREREEMRARESVHVVGVCSGGLCKQVFGVIDMGRCMISDTPDATHDKYSHALARAPCVRPDKFEDVKCVGPVAI